MELIKSSSSFGSAFVYGKGMRVNHGGVWIKFHFVVDSQTYYSERLLYGTFYFNFLKDQYFPVVYHSRDPNKNSLLVNQNDFEYFNSVQPEYLQQYNHKIR